MNKKLQTIVGQLFKTYIVDALSYMAMGIFCSLIIMKHLGWVKDDDMNYNNRSWG